MVAAPTSIVGSQETGVNRAAYQMICGWIIKGLSYLGLEAILYGSNDVLVNNRKVAGNAQKPSKKAFLQHGSLFFNADPQEWARFIRYSPEKLQSIVSINALSNNRGDFVSGYDAIIKGFLTNPLVNQQYELIPLSADEMVKAAKIAKQVYTESHFLGTGQEKEGKACIVDIEED